MGSRWSRPQPLREAVAEAGGWYSTNSSVAVAEAEARGEALSRGGGGGVGEEGAGR